MHQPPSRSEARSERIPTLVVGIAAFGGLAMSLPFVGLIVRTPWSKCWELLASEASLSALRLSMWTSAVAIVFAVAIGVPVAIVLARYGGRSVAMLRLACTISMVLPPVVGGAALLFALGRRGLIGQWMFRWWGIQLPYSSAAVIIAQIFVALPFVVLTVESSIRSADERLEDAGRALGVRRFDLGRGGAWVGSCDRGVRRHRDVCRQLPGQNANIADRDLRRNRKRS